MQDGQDHLKALLLQVHHQKVLLDQPVLLNLKVQVKVLAPQLLIQVQRQVVQAVLNQHQLAPQLRVVLVHQPL